MSKSELFDIENRLRGFQGVQDRNIFRLDCEKRPDQLRFLQVQNLIRSKQPGKSCEPCNVESTKAGLIDYENSFTKYVKVVVDHFFVCVTANSGDDSWFRVRKLNGRNFGRTRK